MTMMLAWVTTPIINTEKTWNLSKMCFLQVKVVKSDTQWTEVKALKCWADENEAKLEVWGQDCSYVHYLKCFNFIPKTHRSFRDCSAS